MLLDGLHAGLALYLAAPLEAALAMAGDLPGLAAHAVPARAAQLLARPPLRAPDALAAVPRARAALGAGPAGRVVDLAVVGGLLQEDQLLGGHGRGGAVRAALHQPGRRVAQHQFAVAGLEVDAHGVVVLAAQGRGHAGEAGHGHPARLQRAGPGHAVALAVLLQGLANGLEEGRRELGTGAIKRRQSAKIRAGMEWMGTYQSSGTVVVQRGVGPSVVALLDQEVQELGGHLLSVRHVVTAARPHPLFLVCKEDKAVVSGVVETEKAGEGRQKDCCGI